MEDRKNYAFESRSSPLLVCNLFAIQGEGPQNAQKQSPAQTQRIHTPSAPYPLSWAAAKAQFETVSGHRLCTLLEMEIASSQAARQSLDDLVEAVPYTSDLALWVRARIDRGLSDAGRC